MLPKKNSSSDLEKRRQQHFQVGMVVVMSIILISLEWSTRPVLLNDLQETTIQYETELIKQIPREEPLKKKKPDVQLLTPVPTEDLDEVVDLSGIEMFNPEYDGQGADYVFSLDDTEERVKEEVINIRFVQVPAEFPGGEKEMMRWIYSHVNYPEEALQNGVEGRVTARFTVNKKGRVEDIRIIGGIHPSLDREVIRLLQSLPDFTPAMQNGRKVPVFMHIPVAFQIQ